MKIEFAEETKSLPLSELISAEESVESSSPEVGKVLTEGIEAAQSGDRAEARNLLLKVTESEPENETAWMWLASISEYPEELLIFLTNVLNVNPENERALKWIEETKALLAKTFVKRGIDAEKEGKKEFAKQCFLQAIVHDGTSELAWLWLASVSDSDEEKVSHLRKVLNINPENEKATTSLDRAKTRIANASLAKAKSAFYEGDRGKAEKFVDACLASDPKFEEALILKSELAESIEEKIACLNTVLEINPGNESALASMETAKFDWIISMLSSAKAALDDGKTKKANEILDKVIEDSPNVIDVWLMKVDMADSVEQKIQHLNHVLEIDPENEFAILSLETQKSEKAKLLVKDAKNALSKNEKPKASELIQKALENAPDLEEAILVKCELVDSLEEKTELLNFVLSKNPNSEAALEQLKKVEDVTLQKLITDVQNAIEADQKQDAREMLQTAIKIAPADENVLFLKYRLSDTLANRSAMIDEILAINPGNSDALLASRDLNMEFAEYSFGQASAAAASGDKPQAEAFLNEAFAYEPKLEQGWLLKAHLADSFDAKIECFERILEINPENSVAQANLLSLKSFVESSKVEANLGSNEEFPENNLESSDQEWVDGDAVTESIKVDLSEVEVVEYDDAIVSEDEEFAYEVAEDDSNELSSKSDADFDERNPGEHGFDDEEPISPITMPDSSNELFTEDNASDEEFDDISDDSLIEVNNKSADNGDSNHHEAGSSVKRVLVVDDSATIRKLISGKLEKSGLETICAVDGVDALDILEELIPDLVLLDIAMPRIDGYQVCKMIRENEATKDIPVIMVSGKDGFFDKALGKLAGSTSYISKPFGPEALMKIVNEHLT